MFWAVPLFKVVQTEGKVQVLSSGYSEFWVHSISSSDWYTSIAFNRYFTVARRRDYAAYYVTSHSLFAFYFRMFGHAPHVANITNVLAHSVVIKLRSAKSGVCFHNPSYANKSNPREWTFLSICNSKQALNNIYTECAFLPTFVISYQNKHNNWFRDRSWSYRRQSFRLSLKFMKLIRFN